MLRCLVVVVHDRQLVSGQRIVREKQMTSTMDEGFLTLNWNRGLGIGIVGGTDSCVSGDRTQMDVRKGLV